MITNINTYTEDEFMKMLEFLTEDKAFVAEVISYNFWYSAILAFLMLWLWMFLLRCLSLAFKSFHQNNLHSVTLLFYLILFGSISMFGYRHASICVKTIVAPKLHMLEETARILK